LLLNRNKNRASSRRQIKIKEVKDGILILPDNQYRVVVETSSINFELKSDEEQDILIDSFQNFLNSLPCQLQIMVRVREIDIDKYVEEIEDSQRHESEKVYKEQINNYSTFIKKMVSGNKILSRRFYIVIPYDHTGKSKEFPLIREQMHLKRDLVVRGLEKMGIKTRILDSLELLDLFYSFYNPNQAKTQQLKGQTIEMLLNSQYAQ